MASQDNFSFLYNLTKTDHLKGDCEALQQEVFNSSETFIPDLLYQLPNDTQIIREGKTVEGPFFSLGLILSPAASDRIPWLSNHFLRVNIQGALLGPCNHSLAKLVAWIPKSPGNSINPSTNYGSWVKRFMKPI